jgi:hypothetical protein
LASFSGCKLTAKYKVLARLSAVSRPLFCLHNSAPSTIPRPLSPCPQKTPPCLYLSSLLVLRPGSSQGPGAGTHLCVAFLSEATSFCQVHKSHLFLTLRSVF